MLMCSSAKLILIVCCLHMNCIYVPSSQNGVFKADIVSVVADVN